MAADNPNTSSMGMDPDLVERRSFDAGFRGFDQHQVRRYLGEVAAELRAAAEREQALVEREEALIEQLHIAEVRAEESASQVAEFELGTLDDDRLSELVGAETTRVLAAAREAAREILAKAEEKRAQLLAESESESESILARAEGLLGERHAEAEAQASEILATAQRQRADAEAAAERVRTDAEVAAESHIEDARDEGLRMVDEARVVREKILRDMARRRNVGRQQVERLRAGRDRLLETYEFVRGSLDDVTAELEGVLSEAKVAADRAADRVDLDLVPTTGELEQDVVEAYESGLVDPAEIDAEAVRKFDRTETETVEGTHDTAEPATAESESIDLTVLEDVEDVAQTAVDLDEGPEDQGPEDQERLEVDDEHIDHDDADEEISSSGALSNQPSTIGQPGLSPMGLTGDAAASSRSRLRRELVDDVELPELTDGSAFEGVRIIGPDPASKPQAVVDEPPKADEKTDITPASRERSGVAASRPAQAGTKMNSETAPMPVMRSKPASRPVVTTPSERTPVRASQASSGRTAEVLEFRDRSSRRSNTRIDPPSTGPDDEGADDEGASGESVEPDASPAKVRAGELESATEDTNVKAQTSEAQTSEAQTSEAQTSEAQRSGTTARSKSDDRAQPETNSPTKVGAPPDTEPGSTVTGSGKAARASDAPGASTVEDVLARLRSGAIGDQGESSDKSDAKDKLKSGGQKKSGRKESEVPDDVDAEFDDRPKPVDAGDPAIIGSRDELTVPVAKDLARKLKRVLSDDQNELLTEIRSRGAKSPLIAEDVGAEDEMVDRYRGAATEGLTAAADAGTTFFGEGSSRRSRDGVGDLASELAESIALPLHERLVRGLDAGDADSVDARIRSAFREVRTSQITSLVDHAVLAAFNRGRLTSLDSKSKVRWVFDTDSTSPCPDCHDNALAGGQPVGEAFPTGHAHPPIHIGCRCLVVPVKA